MTLTRLFPFLRWIKDYSLTTFRADAIAGITVALVLIPQSMAYAQLADLPAYYGLYAAFLPPLVAALFGSSRQLATGPVAIVSLMTSTALAPLATAGSEQFIAYAILLSLLVGVFQLTLGVLRLGMAVNFLSHPVVNGFTNAAALIIATSQLAKLFGVDVDKAEHHYTTVYNTVIAAIHHTHWPTLALAVLAFAIMIILKKVNRRIPNVLVAVLVTTLIAWSTGFEKNYTANLDRIMSPTIAAQVEKFNSTLEGIDETMIERISLGVEAKEAERNYGKHSAEAIELHAAMGHLEVRLEKLKEKAAEIRAEIREYRFVGAVQPDGSLVFYLPGDLPPGSRVDGKNWRFKINNRKIPENEVNLAGGGAVVGNIPSGLPRISLPKIDFTVIYDLFAMAVVISLLGFMEAISIAKAMAAKTGQRLDPNQELIGQGLANIVGSMAQSYPVSGSFSRSAINIQAGALTGFSSAISSLVVLLTLLFFTPLLYYLPQSVLAAIIMMAVIGLVNVSGFVHAWRAQKYDGAIAVISFVATLAFAPHLDRGILIGVVLSLALYLLRNMTPAVAILSKTPDGFYRDADYHGLETCKHVAVIRFNSSLFFANVNYLEDVVLEKVASMPELRHILIVGNGINELDASGEVLLSQLVTRLRERGLDISFSGLNYQVVDVMKRTHLYDKIGKDHFFYSVGQAVRAIHHSVCRLTAEHDCPLLVTRFKAYAVDPELVEKMKMNDPWSAGEKKDKPDQPATPDKESS